MNEIKVIIADLELAMALHAVNDKDKRIKKLLKDALAQLLEVGKTFGGQDTTFGNDDPH